MSDMNFEGFGDLFPEINELNAPYWNGLAQGEVRLQKCGTCGTHQYPPETFCYECGAQNLSWVVVTGEGTVYSFIVVHQPYHKAFKAFLPYKVVIVQMDEGPRMLSTMLGQDKAIAIGDRVKPRICRVDDERAFLTYEPAKS